MRSQLEDDYVRRIVFLRPLLLRQAWYLTHNVADAEDLVQETMLRALTRHAQLTRTETVGNWLIAMQRRIFLDCCRKRQRAPQIIVPEETLEEYASAPTAYVPERIVIGNLEHTAVMQAISYLPILYREVLVLSDVEDLSYQEIAERINIPVGTVRSRLSRARHRVRRAMISWQATGRLDRWMLSGD